MLATSRVKLRPPLEERPEAGIYWGQPSTLDLGMPDDEPEDEPGFTVHDVEPRILIGVETTRDFGEELAQVTIPVESKREPWTHSSPPSRRISSS